MIRTLRCTLFSVAWTAAFAACAQPDTVARDAATRADAAADGASRDAATSDVMPADAPAADAASDVVSPEARPGRTDDDCTAPDLCLNARRCMANRCVVVGGPATCDDSVACTDDRCDPMAGRCTHVPNDMRCPSGQFCIEASGCLADVPCEVGDTTCQRLNSNACMGTWSCDAARRRCIRSAPPSCDDMNACTSDECAPRGTSYSCVNTPSVDFMSSPMHCGGFGMACPTRANPTAACREGRCRWDC